MASHWNFCRKADFEEVATEFAQFVEGAELIIHNAPFDVDSSMPSLSGLILTFRRWLNSVTCWTRCRWRDTSTRAMEQSGCACQRYEIDNTSRIHGALLDAEILAEVTLQ